MCVAMLTITTLTYAQLPKSPDGKDLYQKGDCKTILINVKYKCVFCEDEALTKNCKEYNCTLTECTESKPAKATGGKQLAKPVDIQVKQIRMNQENSDSLTHKDITNHFKTKKVTNGTIVIYEAEDKIKVYATYKNGKLIEWYALGDDGKKINPIQRGLTPTSCEDCVLLPSGVTFCKKCTNTQIATMPSKKAD